MLFCGAPAQVTVSIPDIPEPLITEAYGRAAKQNILAAVNPAVFAGYFSVCADGQGFGYGNTYPSLDGHQMTDALLWLGRGDVAKANWDYVKSFQKPNGQLPLAILPAEAGKMIGPTGFQSAVDPNGGLYRHWVPGDPLRALAGPTFIQNADVIFRFTGDREWLLRELPAINLTADYLATLVNPGGAVGGAGYYIERPTRVEYDGVAACHAADAFRTVSGLNTVAENRSAARKYSKLADLIEHYFQINFWLKDHFAEYINPDHGAIGSHGLTDTDWSSIALDMATPAQTEVLWPKLRDETGFYYNGMPTGIASLPKSYENWESTYDDVMDLAAMGRVWYVEATARARMHDAEGLTETLRRVCREGRENGYWWRERYNEKGGYGAEKYCEYPANLIRILQRFLLGVEFGYDGTLFIGPTVPDEWWKAGFGQTLSWQGRTVTYKMQGGRITGEYTGPKALNLSVRFAAPSKGEKVRARVNGKEAKVILKDGWISIEIIPANPAERQSFAIFRQEG